MGSREVRWPFVLGRRECDFYGQRTSPAVLLQRYPWPPASITSGASAPPASAPGTSGNCTVAPSIKTELGGRSIDSLDSQGEKLQRRARRVRGPFGVDSYGRIRGGIDGDRLWCRCVPVRRRRTDEREVANFI